MQERLYAEGFPADRIMIVGRDLTAAIEVSDGRSSAWAAVRGAVPGLLTGALVGWLLPLTGLVTADMSAVWLTAVTALVGAVLSALIAVLGYALSTLRRSNAAPVQAHRFDLLVDADCADHAARLLRQSTVEAPAGEAAVPPETHQRAA